MSERRTRRREQEAWSEREQRSTLIRRRMRNKELLKTIGWLTESLHIDDIY